MIGERSKPNGATGPAEQEAPGRTKAAAVFADMARVREEQATPLVETEELLVNVSVRKPRSGEFVRVHPDPEMSMPIAIYEDRDEQLVYYVMPEIRSLMGEQLRQAMLVTCINQAGVIFLWPIKQASESGGSHAWSDSAIRAAAQAKTKWIRLIGELRNQSYRCFVAKGAGMARQDPAGLSGPRL
jgi:hypothetical protein